MKKKSILALIIGIMGITTSCSNGDCKAQDQDNGQAVIENIMTRASVRQFTDKAVAKDTLETLVKAGMAAPSAMDKRPWEFVIVTEKAVLDSLGAVHPHANLKTATAAILVCGNMKETIEEAPEYWVQDCSAATENILLAAHGLGLGAVWCGVYPVKERVEAVSGVLGLPEDIVPLNIITMGYPAEQPTVKDKYKSSKIHWQKWQ